jgi:hypothetical protein
MMSAFGGMLLLLMLLLLGLLPVLLLSAAFKSANCRVKCMMSSSFCIISNWPLAGAA